MLMAEKFLQLKTNS